MILLLNELNKQIKGSVKPLDLIKITE